MLKRKNPVPIIFTLFFKASLAFTADLISESIYLDYPVHNPSEKTNLTATVLGHQFVTSPESQTPSIQQFQIAGLYDRKGVLTTRISGAAGTFSTPRSFYVAIPEAFVGVTSHQEKSYFLAGRKIQPFSLIDQNLELGLYNPYMTHDFLQFDEQGLVGIHAQTQASYFGLSAAYLPFFIPNQGPQFYEEDGKIRSASRWKQNPPSKFRFADKDREIVYDIRDYDIGEIVSNSGFAVSTFVGPSALRPWLRASFSRKPLTELPLTRDTYATAADTVGQVKLSPVVTYTQIQSIDLNVDQAWFRSTLSYIEDRPENNLAQDKEALQFLEPLKIYGIMMAIDLSEFLNYQFIAEASYAEIQGGGITDLKADGSPENFTFSHFRTQYQKPVRFKIKTDLMQLRKRPFRTAFSWTYDQVFKGSVFSGLISYEAFAKMNLKLGFDVIGVEKQDYEQNNFLQNNQSNDRVYGGLDYVF